MSKNSFIFNIVGFSTNNDTFNPITILQKFIKNSGNNNIKSIKDNSIKFYYKLENHILNKDKLLISFHEVIKFDKKNHDICSFADLFLIIADLEKDDTYEKLDKIIENMKNICDLEKTIFILGVYTDVQNTKKELDEGNIIDYLDEKKILYEYVESNVEILKDLIRTIDFIIREGIKKIEKKIIELENNELIESQSNSKCSIW